MSASPFRSHLMQQWVRTSQSHVPMVAVPWLKPHLEQHQQPQQQDKDEKDQCQDHSSSRRHPTLSSVDSASYPSSPPHSSWKTHHSHSSSSSSSNRMSRRLLSTSAHSSAINPSSSRDDDDDADEQHDLEDSPAGDGVSSLARSFQSILETRHTASKLTLSDATPRESELLQAALTRAVVCARMAPNHKRTEPWSMRRLMAPSPATEQLAEIAYQVDYNKKESHVSAENKKSKWLAIPAFLVTLVHANQEEVVIQDDATCSPHDVLPFVAPETERQLEDYAAACAAVQNCLLSLHAEDIGSKWATGPVIHTPAFRKLVGAAPTDRVVALVMVGGLKSASSHGTSSSNRRRRRRSLDDILQDVDAS